MVKKEKEIAEKAQKKVPKKEKRDLTPKGFNAIKSEALKVKWPTKKEMIKYSIATIAFIIFFGVFFYLIEVLMAFLKSNI